MNLIRGRTVTGLSLTVLFLAMTGGDAFAQAGPGPTPPPASRMPAPMLPASAWTVLDAPSFKTTLYVTPVSQFAATDPFVNPSNLLPNVYENVKSLDGSEIPNTLPSTPTDPYHLHAAEPVVEKLANSISPADDLEAVFQQWYTGTQALGSYQSGNPYSQANYSYHQEYFNEAANQTKIQRAIDALEGNDMPDRAYSGMPILHIAGGDEVKKIEPKYDPVTNKPIGGNVTVHQVWFNQHIEEDTSFIDPTAMLTPEFRNVPFTITYVVDVLNRGNDDFSPLELFNSDPDLKIGPTADGPLPQVMMDGTFFPMLDGTRTTFVLKMPPAKFFQLIYTWGWRNHPGRIAVMENATKSADLGTGPQWQADLERNVFRQKNCLSSASNPQPDVVTMDMVDPEGNPLPGARCVYGPKIMSSAASKAYAISFIGDLAPAKRMWKALKTLQSSGYNQTVMAEYERAFYQWQNRLKLPDGVKADPNADLTLVYLNNSIYGQQKGMARLSNKPILEQWTKRGTLLNVKVLNGDYFPHGYGAVNFGGLRGWENLYQSAHPIGGDGDTFTFGRAYWGLDTAPKLTVVAAATPSATAASLATPAALKVMADSQLQSTQPLSTAATTEVTAKRNSPLVKYWKKQVYNFQPDNLSASLTVSSPTSISSVTGVPTVAPQPIIGGNGDTLGQWNVFFLMNYEPSLRLRTYQFDPLHHIQAIWAIH